MDIYAQETSDGGFGWLLYAGSFIVEFMFERKFKLPSYTFEPWKKNNWSDILNIWIGMIHITYIRHRP